MNIKSWVQKNSISFKPNLLLIRCIKAIKFFLNSRLFYLHQSQRCLSGDYGCTIHGAGNLKGGTPLFG